MYDITRRSHIRCHDQGIVSYFLIQLLKKKAPIEEKPHRGLLVEYLCVMGHTKSGNLPQRITVFGTNRSPEVGYLATATQVDPNNASK
jgi:hypothetical protein